MANPSRTSIDAPQNTNKTLSKKVKRMLGLDLHGWEAVVVWSLGIAAFAAIAVVISTRVVIILQREALNESAEKIALATAGAAAAHERAAGADLRAAEANARAAEAQLALEKYKAPRTLSDEQKRAIAGAIKPFGKIPFVLALANAPEPADLAGQLANALEYAGWDWRPWAKSDNSLAIVRSFPNKPNMGDASIRGISIDIASSDSAKLALPAAALNDALAAAGLDSTVRAIDPAVASARKLLPGVIHIAVGVKT